jgi:glycerol-3-phosphate dehydrogenase
LTFWYQFSSLFLEDSMTKQEDERDKKWEGLGHPWDIIVIGGGITGAGILHEATRLGLKALLVEQRDFSWGTSSRSSKMVHGGLRYLMEGNFSLTRACLHERERLLAEYPGLIDPLGFLLVTYRHSSPGKWTYKLGMSISDLMLFQWKHRYYKAPDFLMLAPHIARKNLTGGFSYKDAMTDDSRLVLRLIHEAMDRGAAAMNYVTAEDVIRRKGRVVGVRLVDCVAHRSVEVHAQTVINATGAWANHLRESGAGLSLRPLRGSHMIFQPWRLPVAQAISFLHPTDGRHIFVFPWEGMTLLGTTDIDHKEALDHEPAIGMEEAEYLITAAQTQFPELGLTGKDVVSTFAGVRPVVGSGKEEASKEPRDHMVRSENRLLTVTGGKLTTFRLIARDALKAAGYRPSMSSAFVDQTASIERSIDPLTAQHLGERGCRRLLGRYGTRTSAVLEAAEPGELETIGDTAVLWAELRWGARSEDVIHLEDLLLRRVRLGLLLPQGGRAMMNRIEEICKPELGWSDTRWDKEETAYLDLCQRCYSFPEPSTP